MAVCAESDGNGGLVFDESTPLDQCQYIVLDALDYASFIEVPISEVYALLFTGFVAVLMALAVIAGRQRAW